MRKTVCLIVFILTALFTKAQTSSIKVSPKALAGAELAFTNIVGKALFQKHFVLDTLDCRSTTNILYTGDVNKSVTLGRDTVFLVVYFVIQNKDTIGFLDIYIDEHGHPLNDWREPTISGKPEILIGYKKLLTNQFNITYKKAIEIGRKKGYTERPLLNAQTIYKAGLVGKQSFIQVSFFWTFYKITDTQNGSMNVNADTGLIESEQYFLR